MLLQIREFIQTAGVTSIEQLARAFRIEKSALQPMLDFWVNKGCIVPCETEVSCQSGCGKGCRSDAPVYYCWGYPNRDYPSRDR